MTEAEDGVYRIQGTNGEGTRDTTDRSDTDGLLANARSDRNPRPE